ncbi:MAG: deoxyribonuclease IV [Syntrophorhabdaceae bacterium]|nr:deoxyribonuclease IV [Syntrophorhabdaceae bacterium]
MKIGFHLKISMGFNWTLKEAHRLGCEVVQIFVKNPRSWGDKEWKKEEIDAFKTLSQSMPVYAHLSYLPNIAKTDQDKRHLDGFLKEAYLCKGLNIQHLVVHCGSREDKKKGIRIVSDSIDKVLEEYEDLTILIENSSGQGNALGSTIEELASIHNFVSHRDRLLLCLDTAHLFQAGYDIRSKRRWNEIVTNIEDRFGHNKIGLLHLNDSKSELNSRVDRHWHIGLGFIGLPPFKFIVNDKRFAHLCGVMETPKMGRMDEENMKVIRSLLSPLMSRSSS